MVVSASPEGNKKCQKNLTIGKLLTHISLSADNCYKYVSVELSYFSLTLPMTMLY